ncbi:NAD-dependent epimerase/dehydratase family protein [Silvimonas amylolytica]|uniref:NAD-dependent epimerase n=1 Tax=Silvimonas amylolytica TaxID=449663 RepID=A0ABQ2PH84_9NEIS|nr:NAD-dependent epimerase/dehydratase family protein [Silvimonas amylolytica]GGP24964.1 NAD-dependent epimerase [Silvimonas amylolytica]
MEKIALVGATGAMGHSIGNALAQTGQPWRAIARSQSALQQQFGADPRVECVTWNPDDAPSIKAALQGIDTVVYVVGVPYWQFELHPILLGRTLEAAIAAGVKRFILIGTVYPYGRPQQPRVTEDHPRQPHTFKGQRRKEQEDLLLAAHAAGRIQGTVLRLPDFYGPGVDKSFLDGVFKAAVAGKAADMIGPIDTPHEFVFVPDVGPVVLRLAAEPQAYGRVWHLAGAGVTSQKKLAEQIFATAGSTLRTRVLGKLALRVLGLFNPMLREMVEMHYLQTEPVIMDDSALHHLLGTIHKTSYEEGIRQTLAATRG